MSASQAVVMVDVMNQSDGERRSSIVQDSPGLKIRAVTVVISSLISERPYFQSSAIGESLSSSLRRIPSSILIDIPFDSCETRKAAS